MNKRFILIISLALLAFLTISAVSAEGLFDFSKGNEGYDPSDKDFTLVVGISEFPPFVYKDNNGNYTGFDIDLAREVANRNNWKFKAQPIIDWETKEFELNSNEINCIWSEFTIDGRENEYSWSKPYFNNSQVIVVKSNSDINSIDDLKGKVIEIESSSSALNAVENNKTLKDSIGKINGIENYDTAFMDLNSEVCDAVIVDYPSAEYRINEKFTNDTFRVLDEPVAYEKYGVAFKKGNDELKNQVQKTLDEMFKDGTVDEIAQKYSDYGIPERIINP